MESDLSTYTVYNYVLPFSPFESNRAYPTNRKGVRYLDPVAREYKENIIKYSARTDELHNRPVPKWDFVQICMVIYLSPLSMYYKYKDDLKSRDTSNFIKLIEDAYSEYCGLDDKYNLDVLAFKRLSPFDQDFILLELSPNTSPTHPVHGLSDNNLHLFYTNVSDDE